MVDTNDELVKKCEHICDCVEHIFRRKCNFKIGVVNGVNSCHFMISDFPRKKIREDNNRFNFIFTVEDFCSHFDKDSDHKFINRNLMDLFLIEIGFN